MFNDKSIFFDNTKCRNGCTQSREWSGLKEQAIKWDTGGRFSYEINSTFELETQQAFPGPCRVQTNITMLYWHIGEHMRQVNASLFSPSHRSEVNSGTTHKKTLIWAFYKHTQRYSNISTTQLVEDVKRCFGIKPKMKGYICSSLEISSALFFLKNESCKAVWGILGPWNCNDTHSVAKCPLNMNLWRQECSIMQLLCWPTKMDSLL